MIHNAALDMPADIKPKGKVVHGQDRHSIVKTLRFVKYTKI